jgi:hypothetical protein
MRPCRRRDGNLAPQSSTLRHENIEWLYWRTLCSKSPFPTLALSVVAAETIEGLHRLKHLEA